MSYHHIDVNVNTPVIYITMSRPDRLNAVSMEMWSELREALLNADDNENVRVVVLSGAGEAFCAGDEIQELHDLDTPSEIQEYTRHVLKCTGTIENIGIPVIAKVNGVAYGVGCEIAGLCDITIATTDATFSLVEPKIGVSPLNGLFRFPKLIGLKSAREMMLTARTFTADDALRMNLVSAVVTKDEIDYEIQKRIDEIVENAPIAIEMTKQMLNGEREGADQAVNVLSYTCLTDDRIEGTDAFLKKRKARWKRN